MSQYEFELPRSICARPCWHKVALLILIIFLGAGSAAAEDNTLRVGVYQNPPKVFTDDSGKAAGIFIDIIETIAAEEGWGIEYVPGSWSEGLQRLHSGRIDLMPDVAYSSARAKRYTFGEEPVLSDWFQVYISPGSKIRSLVDLNHKSVAVLDASVQKEAFEQLLRDFDFNIEIVSLPDYATIFSRVENGSVDAAITNRFHGSTYAPQFNLNETAIIFHPTRLFIAAPPDKHADLLAVIDAHLRHLKQDRGSAYYTSLQHWTSEEIAFETPDWVQGVALLGGMTLIFALLGNIVLKKRVNVRTRQLQQANAEMEQRIRERTAELEAAMKEARAADQVKSAFLASMSHELRTPLNSIIGFTGILLQELPGPLNQEQSKQMQLVQKSARLLLSLISDVLDISRIEAGQLELSPATFEAHTALENAHAIIEPLAVKKGLALHCYIDPDVGLINTDQRRLEQILLNLLSNAVKFTDSGRIRIACYRREDGYVFEVSDTGIGIPQEHLPKLFGDFYQVESERARRREGTGLGLSICKKLAEMMGGSIEVESKVGCGSVFRLCLPRRMG